MNIVRADALTLETCTGGPVTFAEWSYLARQIPAARPPILDVTHRADFKIEDTPFRGGGPPQPDEHGDGLVDGDPSAGGLAHLAHLAFWDAPIAVVLADRVLRWTLLSAGRHDCNLFA